MKKEQELQYDFKISKNRYREAWFEDSNKSRQQRGETFKYLGVKIREGGQNGAEINRRK